MRKVLLLLTVIFLVCGQLLADEILLKNGNVLEGVIKSETATEVVILISRKGADGTVHQVPMTIKRDNIRRLTRDRKVIRRKTGKQAAADSTTLDLSDDTATSAVGAAVGTKPNYEPVKGDPKAMLQKTFGILASSQPGALWELLPASYQNDINGLVHLLGKKMNADVWHGGFRVLGKVNNVLRTKKELIFFMPQVAAGGKKVAEVQANWDAIVDFIEIIVQSDFAKVDKLQTMNVGPFFATFSSKLMGALASIKRTDPKDDMATALKKLRETSVEVVARDATSVTMEIKTPGEPMKRVVFVIIEGKWVPKEMADGWAKELAQARLGLTKLNDDPKQTARILGMIGQVEAVVDNIQGANSKEDFQKAVQAAMGSLLPLLMGGMSGRGVR